MLRQTNLSVEIHRRVSVTAQVECRVIYVPRHPLALCEKAAPTPLPAGGSIYIQIYVTILKTNYQHHVLTDNQTHINQAPSYYIPQDVILYHSSKLSKRQSSPIKP